MTFDQLKQKIENLDPKKAGDWKELADALVTPCDNQQVSKDYSDACKQLRANYNRPQRRVALLKAVLYAAYKDTSNKELADLLNGFAKKAGINYQHKK